jgi:hypothetical protein
MAFSLIFDTDNDAFTGDPTPEVVRILREAATRIESGWSEGTVYDLNGNRVGGYRLLGVGQ